MLLLDKCERKGTEELESLVDLVGARVVCLFRSDLSAVGDLIAENFEITEIDDKVSVESGPLGYMSIHYICKMPKRYKGPRYENTSNVKFEIQVRTLCMHAWAAISHHLDYKGDWDVPQDLKRALSALSGLFYVADNEFEQFYRARLESKRTAEQEINKVQEINLDTVQAYLERRFPDRLQGGQEKLSEFVHELKTASFKSLVEVEEKIDSAYVGFTQYEGDNPPSDAPRFAAIGVARMALILASDEYAKVRKKSGRTVVENVLKYRKFLGSAAKESA